MDRHPHTPVLTAEIVHEIRTSDLTDAELAAKYRVSWTSINKARRGLTWAKHPTPPDRRSRHLGMLKGVRASDFENAPSMDLEAPPYDRVLYDRLRIRCRVDADGCWIWTSSFDSSLPRPTGHHGHTQVHGKSIGTHRAMWLAVHGPIPEGMSVCHECDKPLCLRPNHLFLGTHLDNMRDAIEKGRHVSVDRLERLRRGLTDAQVHAIRTEGLTDAHWSRKLRTTITTIWKARTGVSHQEHPTPPDLRRRMGGGRKASSKAVHDSDSNSFTGDRHD